MGVTLERGDSWGGVRSRIKKVASVERYLEFGGRGEVGDLWFGGNIKGKQVQ